ncbi:ribosome production factor 2-like protein [Cucumis melo var. makuwa]|uniref:Ribosome production factor 2 homolog n=1 Tax=Cucumis melo var. makuwa TaxID=1194695 RepID=A0A5A7UP47_CUCMM|nr:ribosome production factor 2-like protein [Cucumis melo var. makuwa]
MLQIRTPKNRKVKRELEKRAPKLVETGKKTLILHGTKTSGVLNEVLTELYHLKKESAVKYSRKNDGIKPFESGGDASLEFFSLKTDCSIILVGIENFKSMHSFAYDKKLAPRVGSKPFITFIGEGFENVEELKHLKEVLLDLFRGEVVENLNLSGLDRVYVCTAISPNKVFLTHCALRLKKSGSVVPRMELVEVGPSMDMVIRRHRLPTDGLRKEAMKTAKDKAKKKEKNVSKDIIQGKVGRIYIPDQKGLEVVHVIELFPCHVYHQSSIFITIYQHVLGAPPGHRRPDFRSYGSACCTCSGTCQRLGEGKGRGKLASDKEESVTCHMGTQFCFRVYVSVF